eukprot:scaffold114108_cov18-Tisochrysis_lutea.AAC.2
MKDKALVARYSQRGCRAATCACEPEALCMDESRTKLHTYLEAGVIRDTQLRPGGQPQPPHAVPREQACLPVPSSSRAGLGWSLSEEELEEVDAPAPLQPNIWATQEELVEEQVAQEELAQEEVIQEELAQGQVAQEVAQEQVALEELAQEELAQKLTQGKLKGACKDRAVTKVAAHFRHTLMRLSMLCNTLTGLPVKGSGSTVKPVNKAAMGNLVPTPVHTGLGAKAPHRFGSVSAVSS